jgi:LDH2 family malate/lactate/ureidoglycolate dehydrogenase
MTSRVAADRLRRQLAAIFGAWGMPAGQAAVTVERMVESDLRGVDSHGVAMLALYDELRREGRLTVAPEVRVVRESPVTALIDGGGGLGHYPSTRAMELAVAKAMAAGIGAVAVRNSNHYGAAGVYALMAVRAGLIGVSTTGVHRPAVVPTFAAEPMFGTNPIAFAAPAGRNSPFCLDMATSTVAIGKLKLAAFAGRVIPEGWAVDDRGRPLTDPHQALRHRHLTFLGGTPEMSSHKGYGLGAMVEILSTILPGASYAPLRQSRRPGAARHDVGHFFLALDPKAFRGEGEFEADLDDMIDALHAARPADPAEPVLVAGDPETRAVAERERDGIPLSPAVLDIVRAVCAGCGAPNLLTEAT